MPRISTDAISDIVGSIYEAAYDARNWEKAIARIHAAFDCSRACILVLSPEKPRTITTIDDPEFTSPESMAAHSRDPFLAAALAPSVGRLYRSEEVIDMAAFRRRELWNEWMRPRDMWDSLSCNLRSDDRQHWSVHLHRGRRQAAFADEETRAFRICLDHMLRASAIARQIEDASVFGDLFANLPMGVAIVDSQMRIEYLNPASERLLSFSSALSVAENALRCRNAAQHAVLAALIERATVGTFDSGLGGGLVLRPDDGEGAAVALNVSPFVGESSFLFSKRPMALVMMRSLRDRASAEMEDHLRMLHGLTSSESRLAMALTAGLTLQQAAERQGITVKSARTYLERIFSKTGTARQSQLVALLGNLQPFA